MVCPGLETPRHPAMPSSRRRGEDGGRQESKRMHRKKKGRKERASSRLWSRNITMSDRLEQVATLAHGKKGEVLCLHSGEGNGALASGGADGTVRIWDLAAGKVSRALLMPPPPTAEEDKAVTAVCIGDSSSHLVYAAVGMHVYGYDLRAPGMLLREPAWRHLNLAKDEIGHMALHESGSVLATADDAGDVHIVDVSSGASSGAAAATAAAAAAAPRITNTLSGVHTSICSSVAFRPGGAGTECCSAGLDALVVRWDWRIAAKLDVWPLMRRPIADVLADAAENALGLRQQHQQAGSSSGGGESQQQQLFNPRHAHCVSFAPDGGAFALALGDGTVEVRLTQSGEPIAAVDGHRCAASQAHFCPQILHGVQERLRGSFSDDVMARWLPLVTAGDDRRLRVWAVEGVAGRGRRSGDTKRQRRAGPGDAAADDEDEDEDEVFGEPGFRALASSKLKYKPNGVAASADANGRALVCVATCADDGAVAVFEL